MKANTWGSYPPPVEKSASYSGWDGKGMARLTGKVEWFNNPRGYGFISYDGGPNVFVHHSAIQMEGYHSLIEGQVVEFEIETGPTGKPQAANVVKIQPAT